MCNLINVNTWFSTPNWAYVEGTLCWSETDLICITPVRLVSWGRAEGRLGCECLNLRNCKIEMWMNYIMVEHSFTFSYSPPPQSKHEEFTLTNINICVIPVIQIGLVLWWVLVDLWVHVEGMVHVEVVQYPGESLLPEENHLQGRNHCYRLQVLLFSDQ